jgi:hypothetical protein
MGAERLRRVANDRRSTEGAELNRREPKAKTLAERPADVTEHLPLDE